MRRLPLILCFLMFLMAGCGDEDHFRVKGTVDGNATLNIRVGYYSGGAYRSLLTAAREGQFEFAGSAPEGAVVNLYDHEYRLIGIFYGCNGTDYELGIVRSNPFLMTVKADGRGAEISDRFSGFITSVADSLRSRPNGVIEDYVTTHTGDLISTLLMTNLYDASADPLMADSLLESIEPSARPSALTGAFTDQLRRIVSAFPPPDTIDYRTTGGGRDTFYFRESPVTLFVADTRHSERNSKITPVLKSLTRRYPSSKLSVMEISLDNDTMEWKRSIAQDTAKWIQTWTPGAFGGPLAANLGVDDVPFFVVVDSAGTVLYRGNAINRANEIIIKSLTP